MPQRAAPLVVILLLSVLAGPGEAQRPKRVPLAPADIDAIATLLMLEDARRFDEPELTRILKSAHPEVRRRAVQSVGRIADQAGLRLVEAARRDPDPEVAATAVWAAGQLKDPAAVPWLAETLSAKDAPLSAREAAIALGKIQAPPARAALAAWLSSAPLATPATVVGGALLSIGRYPAAGDLAPIQRWTSAKDAEVRWRAAWALFRTRDPGALPELLRLSSDPSGDVRFWAVRGLIPHPGVDPAPAAARLHAAVKDSDRRVRTEALRALGLHDDDPSFALVLENLDAPDTWLSVSAAELLARYTGRAEAVIPRLVAAAAPTRPLSVRLTARRSLDALGAAGKSALEGLSTDGLPAPPARGGGRGSAPQPQLRDLADYRRIVQQWIVPDYNGARKPRAIWETARGTIELELYPGDAPLGLEHLIRVTESGEILGAEFSRVVPNFVVQQRGVRNDVVLRDEVSRLGLTRGNLSWASAGLDTGRPGYTLGITPQPHNEGNFTALGRVIRGMDAVERLELGDKITAARMVK